jgi:hypothetical protein
MSVARMFLSSREAAGRARATTRTHHQAEHHTVTKDGTPTPHRTGKWHEGRPATNGTKPFLNAIADFSHNLETHLLLERS